MDPNQPPRYPHAHNSSYLDFDPVGNEESSQDPNVWSYDYVLTSHDTPNTTPTFAWPDQQQRQQQFPYAPTLPSNADAAHQHFLQQHHPNPSPGAYHTPVPDSYYLINSTTSPYAYHASPHLSAYPSPVSRSMSVSAVSNTSIDPANSNPRQQSQAQATNTFLPTPRQIRFVSTDGQPHAKRRRINAACLTCRKRKTRCSGERPVCKTCTDNGHRCAGYAEKTPRKEGERTQGDGDGDNDDEDDSRSPSPGRPKDERNSSGRADIAKQVQATDRYHGRQSGPADSQSRHASNEKPYEETSPMSNYTACSGSIQQVRTRVPYFRYFGPTAIVPGFKQMVVQMKDSRETRRSQPSITSGSSNALAPHYDGSTGATQEQTPVFVELPYYEAGDSVPNPPLITDLCETFFVNLGCNYPFLQRAGFLRDLEEKRVDAILVNAVCALSARFSSDPILTKPSDDSLPLDSNGHVKRAFRGQPFAQRAMSAVIDMFPCPTLAVTQACLLLGYEEFGSDRDSGLWMYLGTSIRMAQDLGIQKLEGLQLEGRLGPTPKTAKKGEEGKQEELKRAEQQNQLSKLFDNKDDALYEDRRASERERIDTFWSIFFLDRAVSSGVGRPVTLRDKDIEISFPYRSDEQLNQRHPDPFPALIRIVHMYGRVADVINNIEDVAQVTPDVLGRLAAMEKDLTGIYQKLSPRLHFNATNFQYYVKAGKGTNFILLHFWFHTLIVLLHQPTLLHSFEGRIQQLFPDSRELSMSSAKTIADILAFAEFIDVKSFVGNPFTSQPMYVAACAFLAEVAAHSSQPPSRGDSPTEKNVRNGVRAEQSRKNKEAEQKIAAKHSLLTAAANQNYQRCYRALKTLDSYWAGCRYILTALDQKSNGLADPLLFTSEDVDEMPSTEPSFTTPGWRKSSFGVSLGRPVLDKFRRSNSQDIPWSPKLDFGNAIGWSITGTANSPAPNLSFLYQNPGIDNEQGQSQHQQTPSHSQKVQIKAQVARQTPLQDYQHMHAQPYHSTAPMMPPQTRVSSLPYDPVSTAEADLLLGLHSPYSAASTTASATSNPKYHAHAANEYTQIPASHPQHQQNSPYFQDLSPSQFNDMFIESQDIDMSKPSNLQLNNFTFPGGDMIPWLEYLPPDVLNYFGDPEDMNINVNSGTGGNPPHEILVPPTGPGPPPHSSYDRGPGGPEPAEPQRHHSGR